MQDPCPPAGAGEYVSLLRKGHQIFPPRIATLLLPSPEVGCSRSIPVHWQTLDNLFSPLHPPSHKTGVLLLLQLADTHQDRDGRGCSKVVQASDLPADRGTAELALHEEGNIVGWKRC